MEPRSDGLCSTGRIYQQLCKKSPCFDGQPENSPKISIDRPGAQSVSTAPETPFAHGAGFLTAVHTGLSMVSASWRASSVMPL